MCCICLYDVNKKDEFNKKINLHTGENVVELKATNKIGEQDIVTINLNRKYTFGELIHDLKSNFLNNIYSLITLGVGLVFAILMIIFAKKRRDKYKISISFIVLLVIIVLLDIFAIFKYIQRKAFVDTDSFVNMAKNSIIETSNYLILTNYLFKAICIISAFIVLMLIILLFKIVKSKMSSKSK